MAKTSLQEIDSEGPEQSRGNSNSGDLAKLLSEVEDLDLSPLKYQTEGGTAMIDSMVSLAGFLVPFYQGRGRPKEATGKRPKSYGSWLEHR